MSKPYVLTDDLLTVFHEIATTSSSYDVASAIENASNRITVALEEIYGKVERISSERMSNYLHSTIAQTDDPVISLIPLTHRNDYPAQQIEKIESSRTVKPMLGDDGVMRFEDLGSHPRYSGAPSLDKQFERAAKNLNGAQKAEIVDDVLFSGGTIETYFTRLKTQGIAVSRVITNVSIQGGIDRLKAHGIIVDSDLVYQDVIDEVCMRDFIVGAPAGGRNLLRDDGSYAAVPYLAPFGDVSDWASIAPEHVTKFSKTCLEASLEIWTTLGADIKFGDLAKPVFGCKPEDKIATRIQELLDRQAYAGPINPLRL